MGLVLSSGKSFINDKMAFVLFAAKSLVAMILLLITAIRPMGYAVYCAINAIED
jgi:hypothetical protein